MMSGVDYWCMVMAAVAFQSLLTSWGNSNKPFITNVTETPGFLSQHGYLSLLIYCNCMFSIKGENVCVLTYFKILWDPVKVQIRQIPGREVTCKVSNGLVMGEREGERVNVTLKRSGKCSTKCKTQDTGLLFYSSFGVLNKADERWSETLIAPLTTWAQHQVIGGESQVSDLNTIFLVFPIFSQCGVHLSWCSDLDLQTAVSSFQCCHFKHTVEPDFTWKH